MAWIWMARVFFQTSWLGSIIRFDFTFSRPQEDHWHVFGGMWACRYFICTEKALASVGTMTNCIGPSDILILLSYTVYLNFKIPLLSISWHMMSYWDVKKTRLVIINLAAKGRIRLTYINLTHICHRKQQPAKWSLGREVFLSEDTSRWTKRAETTNVTKSRNPNDKK